MKTITTNDHTVIVINVPKEAAYFSLFYELFGYVLPESKGRSTYVSLGDKNSKYSIIGSILNSEQPVFDFDPLPFLSKNAIINAEPPILQFLSLIEVQTGWIAKNPMKIPQTPKDYFDPPAMQMEGWERYQKNKEQWQSYQSRVFDKLIFIEKVI